MPVDRRERGLAPTLALLALLALLTAPASLARAQEPAAEGVAVEEEEEQPAQVNGRAGVFQMTDQQFNIWVFGNLPDSKGARSKLESQLLTQLDDLDRICDLTDDQRLKLELAASGDMKHFFDRIDEKRRKYSAKTYDQNKISEIFQELQPLQQIYNNGLFARDSLFQKTILRTLDTGQSERYQDLQRERTAYRFRAKVDQLAAELGRSLGLRAAQRQQLVKLMRERIPPFRKSGQYDNYALMYKLSKLADTEVKPLLDESQFKVFKIQVQNAQNLKQFLKQQGYFDDDPEETADPVPAKPKGEAEDAPEPDEGHEPEDPAR